MQMNEQCVFYFSSIETITKVSEYTRNGNYNQITMKIQGKNNTNWKYHKDNKIADDISLKS